jgi:hypothetical protein
MSAAGDKQFINESATSELNKNRCRPRPTFEGQKAQDQTGNSMINNINIYLARS